MTETATHELTLNSWAEKLRGKGHKTVFRGVCSCGDQSDKVHAAGIVHGWFADHVNRFPELTRAIAAASSLAFRCADEGNWTRGRAHLRDARVMAQELRMAASEPRRDAEELALAMYDRAASRFPSPEGADDSPGR